MQDNLNSPNALLSKPAVAPDIVCMKRQLREYATGLLVPMHEQGMSSVQGRGWSTELAERRKELRSSIGTKELVIHAFNIETAQKALELIVCAHQLICGNGMLGSDLQVVPEDNSELEDRAAVSPRHFGAISCSTSHFPVATMVAARISQRREFVYALSQFCFSQKLHSNLDVDLDPALFPHPHRSPLPQDHVRYAYALIAAYGTLEQLGLALNGQAFLNKKWIPAVRAELESRLSAAGVDIGQTLTWFIRGGVTNLERSRPPTIVRKASWAYRQIRDCEIELIDGIADLRWLRSGIAAHRMSDLVGLISVYNVANAQALCRRLLLESVGFGDERIERETKAIIARSI